MDEANSSGRETHYGGDVRRRVQKRQGRDRLEVSAAKLGRFPYAGCPDQAYVHRAYRQLDGTQNPRDVDPVKGGLVVDVVPDSKAVPHEQVKADLRCRGLRRRLGCAGGSGGRSIRCRVFKHECRLHTLRTCARPVHPERRLKNRPPGSEAAAAATRNRHVPCADRRRAGGEGRGRCGYRPPHLECACLLADGSGGQRASGERVGDTHGTCDAATQECLAFVANRYLFKGLGWSRLS